MYSSLGPRPTEASRTKDGNGPDACAVNQMLALVPMPRALQSASRSVARLGFWSTSRVWIHARRRDSISAVLSDGGPVRPSTVDHVKAPHFLASRPVASRYTTLKPAVAISARKRSADA